MTNSNLIHVHKNKTNVTYDTYETVKRVRLAAPNIVKHQIGNFLEDSFEANTKFNIQEN